MIGSKEMNKVGSAFIVGGVGIDEIQLPTANLKQVVGGSSIYGSIAGSLFAKTMLGGIVGNDFPKAMIKTLVERGVNVDNLQKSKKKATMHWYAKYSSDLSEVTTIRQESNSMVDYDPKKIVHKNKIATAFVSNNDPEVQLEIIKALPKETITIADSMDLWIVEKREKLFEVLKRVDVFFINKHEAELVFDESVPEMDVVEHLLSMGPKVIIYKKGEYGLTMFGKYGTMFVPSYPLTHAVDPTGAGDALGGGMAAVLATLGELNEVNVKTAMVIASILASFTVEDYGLEGILNVTKREVLNRTKLYLKQLPSREDLVFGKLNGI